MQYAALFLCLVAPAAAIRGSIRGSSGLLTDMRPEVVSKLLGEVTNKWVVDFVGVLRNTTVESQAYGDMEKSCLKVSKSIIAGSDGDEDRVSEYMKEVCEGNSNAMCTEFASGMDSAMIGDANFNREKLNLNKFCKSFWTSNVGTAAQKMKSQLDTEEKTLAEKKAQEEKDAAEKKAAEEKAAAEKKEADDKAAAEKKAADEKAAAEKKAADEAKAAEEAKKKQESDQAQKEADQAAAEAKRDQDLQAAAAMREATTNKTMTLTAAIAKTAQVQEENYNATEESVSKLLVHAKQAIQLAAKKEAEAAELEKKQKEAAAAAASNKTVSGNGTQENNTVPAAVETMVAMNLTKEDAAAKEAGDAVADKIVAKATEGNKTVSK